MKAKPQKDLFFFYFVISYVHVFQWPTSGFMNAARNSEDAVVFLDTSNTADWNSGLKITFLKYQDN